jgi:hypothetical protein
MAGTKQAEAPILSPPMHKRTADRMRLGPTSTKAAADETVLKTRQQLEDDAVLRMRKVMGSLSDDAAGRLTIQTCHALVWPPVEPDAAIVAGVAAMAEMGPRTGIEGMLAVQMIAAHNAALMFLNRATIKEQLPDAIDSNVTRASRLMRVFAEQIEALQKLKGKTGQQRVTVKHVHVHDGGRAIVGAVNANPGGGGNDVGGDTP